MSRNANIAKKNISHTYLRVPYHKAYASMLQYFDLSKNLIPISRRIFNFIGSVKRYHKSVADVSPL